MQSRPYSPATRHRYSALALALGAALLTAGCGGSSTDKRHDHTPIDSTGRLAITEVSASTLRVMELGNAQVISSFTLPHTPTALNSSPDGRYAIAIQRNNDLVSFVDGGLWTEDHGDHMHDYEESPQHLNFTLTSHRPTHFQSYGHRAALFFDGSAEGASARVQVLSDGGIGNNQVVATLERDNSMHGAAQVVGELLFATYRDASITDTTLPAAVERHRQTGNGYTFEERYAEPCERLHGSASNAGFTAFGCVDGVLVINRGADGYPASKMLNPATVPENARIGTLAGHPAVASFVGIAGSRLYDIDPASNRFELIAWKEDGIRRAHGFDAHGENFLVLDNDGVLHLLDPANDFTTRASLTVLPNPPAEAPWPVITVAKGSDRVFINDRMGNAIVEVDLEEAEVVRRIELDFSPAGIAWLGFEPHGDHHH
ncbi:MAG: hypothetical protein LAT63_00745 [Marinobacter sp.]|nr:hypothetical protein [Marinobacter sp.]